MSNRAMDIDRLKVRVTQLEENMRRMHGRLDALKIGDHAQDEAISRTEQLRAYRERDYRTTQLQLPFDD